MVTLSEVRFNRGRLAQLQEETGEMLTGQHAEGVVGRIPIIGGLIQYLDVDVYARDRDSGSGIGVNTRGLQNLGRGGDIGNMPDAIRDVAREIHNTFAESQIHDANGLLLNVSAEDRAKLAAEYALPLYTSLANANRPADAELLISSLQAQGFANIEADMVAMVEANRAAEEARARTRDEREKGRDLDRARGATLRGLDPDATVAIDAAGAMTGTNVGTAEAPVTLGPHSSLQQRVTALLTAETIQVVDPSGATQDASNNQARALQLVRLLAAGGENPEAQLTALRAALEGNDNLTRNASNLLRSLTPAQIQAAVPNDIPNYEAMEAALVRTREELRQAVRANGGRTTSGDGAGGIFQLIAAFFVTAFVQDPEERERILTSMFPNRASSAAETNSPEAAATTPTPEAPPVPDAAATPAPVGGGPQLPQGRLQVSPEQLEDFLRANVENGNRLSPQQLVAAYNDGKPEGQQLEPNILQDLQTANAQTLVSRPITLSQAQVEGMEAAARQTLEGQDNTELQRMRSDGGTLLGGAIAASPAAADNTSLVTFAPAMYGGAPLSGATQDDLLPIDRLFRDYDRRSVNGATTADRILDQQELSRLGLDVLANNSTNSYADDLAFKTLLAANNINPNAVGLQWEGNDQAGHFVPATPTAADASVKIAR
ncbi:MAG: hypothetical protein ACOYJ2_05465 [Rickettsiales bacterium]